MKIYLNLNLFLILFLLISFWNCTTVDYIGKTYPKTSNIDIYYSAEEVKSNYKTIGYAVGYKQGYDAIIGKLVEEAKFKGADAIIITGIDVEVTKDDETKKVTASMIKYLK